MTDFSCPNGSGPQSGAPPFFVYDDAYIATKFGNLAGWLTTWAMGLPFEPQVTADFCAAGPPTELPVAADWAALAVPGIALATGAYRRFANQIKADKWAELCQCNPPLVAGCGSALVVNNDPIGVDNSVKLVTAWRIPTSATGASVTIHPHNIDSGGAYKAFLNGSPTETASGTPTLASQDHPSGGDAAFSASFAAGAYAWLQLWVVSDSGHYGAHWDITLQFSGCTTGAPIPYTAPPAPAAPTGYPTPTVPTCTTTADLCAELAKLSQRMQIIRTQVDLIQRQSVPFAYIAGPVSGPLVGSGTIATGGLLGVLLEVTAYPANRLTLEGTPPYIYDLGWVSINSADGMIEEHRIAQSNSVWFPRQAALATSIGYWLNDGVSMTLTQVLREF
jgi:hypothetical protein